VLGSAGRGESLLALDQDNALVFAEGAPDGAADRWFARLGTHIADILHEVGVPYCKGGVMARNAQWRGSVATWRARIEDWITRSRPEDLLSVDIFFDLLGVHGEVALADDLWRGAFDAARGNAGFAKLLAEAAGAVEPGLNWLGGFRTAQGRIDLKRAGLFGIVTLARTLAIRHHVVARATAMDRVAHRDRNRLREALRAVANLEALTRDLLFRG
jgi:DNA polymerase-3 subunit epsilon/CBS domain-containing protein